ncbi:MAG: UDP-2,3-diacylglucosamine diphosphatase, partial [Euryarchaeota archaeon TMED97]
PETFLMHGNRDFLIGETFANEVGISILPDPYTLDINGLRTILSHGDFLCTDDVDYIDFRSKVRSEEWQKNFLSKSLDERKEIANSLRSGSKDATSEKSLEITDVNAESLNSFLNKNKSNIFIHGHTHRPGIHKTESSKQIVLGDWGEYGWDLAINEKDCDLQKFKI